MKACSFNCVINNQVDTNLSVSNGMMVADHRLSIAALTQQVAA